MTITPNFCKTSFLLVFLLSAPLVFAKDSYWECTKSDGTISYSVVKCEKGERSKLVVLDDSKPAENVVVSPSPAATQTLGPTARGCNKLPVYCNNASALTSAQRIECNVAETRYRECFPNTISLDTCKAPPAKCDGRRSLLRSDRVECDAFERAYALCLRRKQ